MRSVRNYVNTDGTTNIKSTFLSCEKDAEPSLENYLLIVDPIVMNLSVYCL